MASGGPSRGAFPRLWVATAASNLADGMRAAAVPLLAAGLTRDPLLVAGLAVATTLPWLVVGPLSGVLVDRIDRRLAVAAGDAVRAAALALLAVAVLTDTATLPLLYAVAVLSGAAESVTDSAAPALVPALVERRELIRANGRLGAAQTVGQELLGPLAGAVLFAVAAAAAFGTGAAAFALAAGLAATLPRVRARTDPDAPGVGRAVREGAAWLWRHGVLRALCLTVFVLALADAAWFAVLVLFVQEELGVGSTGFGVLLAVAAAGGVGGAVSAPAVSRRLGAGATLLGAVVAAAVAQGVIGLSSSAPLVGAMLAVGNGAFGLWNVVAVTLRQELVPDALLGRASSVYHLLGFAGAGLGALLGGVLAQQAGLRAPFLAGVPLLLGAALLARPRLGNRAVAAARASPP